MRYRWLVLFGALTAVVAVVSMPIAAQAPRVADSVAASNWTHPRTAWGDPDLQGIWRSKHRGPLERPARFAGREFLTDTEVAELERRAEESNARRLAGKQVSLGNRRQLNYNAIVGYSPEKALFSRRTSAIIDPPDGLLPPWTLEQVNLYEAREAATLGRGDADWTVDRPSGERCIPVVDAPVLGNWGLGARRGRSAEPDPAQDPDFVGAGGNDSRRIVQAPGYVVLMVEEGFMDDYRIIPLDGPPHLGQKFRLWQGDSRGHWEGNTLVVETTNIKYPYPIITSYGGNYPGDAKTLTFTERFTRVGPDTIEYRYTVDDPAVYTRPYTVLRELTRDDNWKVGAPICHEGHDDMPSALASGRMDEESSIDNANDTKLEREPRLKELREEAVKAAEARKRQSSSSTQSR